MPEDHSELIRIVGSEHIPTDSPELAAKFTDAREHLDGEVSKAKTELLTDSKPLPKELVDFIGQAQQGIKTQLVDRFGLDTVNFPPIDLIVSKHLEDENTLGHANGAGILLDYDKILRKCGGDEDLALMYSARFLVEELFHSTHKIEVSLTVESKNSTRLDRRHGLGNIIEEGLAFKVVREMDYPISTQFPSGYATYIRLCKEHSISPHNGDIVFPGEDKPVGNTYPKSEGLVTTLAMKYFRGNLKIFYEARIDPLARMTLLKTLVKSFGSENTKNLLSSAANDFENGLVSFDFE